MRTQHQSVQWIGSHQRVVQRVRFNPNEPQEKREDFVICLDCGLEKTHSHELAKERCRR